MMIIIIIYIWYNIDLYNRINNKSNNITEYKYLMENIYLFNNTYDKNKTLINTSYFWFLIKF